MPARSHLDGSGGADFADPLRGAARRHQIVDIVDGQHVDHHAARFSRLAAAHPKRPVPAMLMPDSASQRISELAAWAARWGSSYRTDMAHPLEIQSVESSALIG